MSPGRRPWIIALGLAGLLLAVGALLGFRSRPDRSGSAALSSPDPSERGRAAAIRSTTGRGSAGSPGTVPRFVSEPGLRPRYTAAATLAYRPQRHNWDARTPVFFFQQETRSEPWAGRMEATLRQRFDQRKLRELNIPSLRVDALDCRSSACALEISWDQKDQLAVEPLSQRVRMDPLAHLTTSTGPLAATEFRERPRPGETVVPNRWAVRRRDDGRLAVRDVILFGEQDIDPDGYQDWVDRLAANMRSAPDLVR